MNLLTIAIILSIVLAFVFTFLNGMNDAANSISTIIATKVMTPLQAILWASFWEFAAFIIIRLVLDKTFAVGNTMANFADQNVIDPYLILSALVGAAIWVWVCTKNGMPISTSHALIGGIIGAIGTGFLASDTLGGVGYVDGVTMGGQVYSQIIAVLITIVWCGVISAILYKVVDLIIGLRPTVEAEREGLDLSYHGEAAYHSS
jgi:phosphate/sulfate permease